MHKYRKGWSVTYWQSYYQITELTDISDPQQVLELLATPCSSAIFQWQEASQFCEVFFTKNKSNAAISNICKPEVQPWKLRYTSVIDSHVLAKYMQ